MLDATIYKDFVLDQLQPAGNIRARAMFGGHGIYCDGVMFAALAGGRLFFKVDAQSRQDYIARGLGPFITDPGQTISSYYEVPPAVIEDQDELIAWAIRAIAAARAAAAVRTQRRRRSAH